MRHSIGVVLLLVVGVAPAAEPEGAVRRVGTMSHPPLAEVSGIAASRTWPGVWWVQNDSGDSARIFAIDATGEAILPEWARERYFVGEPVEGKEEWPGLEVLAAANVDWEDLALADGTIYIAETGNNFNSRRDLGVYVLPEPNPATQRERALTFLPIVYPDQQGFPERRWEYDCESLFVADGKLWFLTKERADGQPMRGKLGTHLYRLDTDFTDRPNVLTLVDERADLALPTGAALSPDGKQLAVLTVRALRVFDRPAAGDRWLTDGAESRIVLDRDQVGQAEAVCFDDDQTIRIASEDRGVFVVRLADLRPPADAPLPGPPADVAVGEDPERLIAFDSGRKLAALCLDSHEVAIVDVARRAVERKIALPVRATDTEGEPTSAFLCDAAEDPDSGALFMASTEGQLFRVDPETGETTTVLDRLEVEDEVFQDPVLAWDAPRKRLLLAAVQDAEPGAALLSLRDGVLTRHFDLTRSPAATLVDGDRLWVACMDDVVSGEGEHASDLTLVDLAKDDCVDVRTLPTGFLSDLAPGEGGRFFAADAGVGRILHFDASGRHPSTRTTEGFWRNGTDGFSPYRIAADAHRLLAPAMGDQRNEVYEYAIRDGALSEEPVKVYVLPHPGPIDVVVLPGGLAAVALPQANLVRFLDPEDANSFAGWGEEK